MKLKISLPPNERYEMFGPRGTLFLRVPNSELNIFTSYSNCSDISHALDKDTAWESYCINMTLRKRFAESNLKMSQDLPDYSISRPLPVDHLTSTGVGEIEHGTCRLAPTLLINSDGHHLNSLWCGTLMRG